MVGNAQVISNELIENFGPKIMLFLKYIHTQRVQSGILPPTHDFHDQDWKAQYLPVSVQKDGVNCGIFVLLNMYRMMKNVSTDSPRIFNHQKRFSNTELSRVRQVLVDICTMKASIEALDSFNP